MHTNKYGTAYFIPTPLMKNKSQAINLTLICVAMMLFPSYLLAQTDEVVPTDVGGETSLVTDSQTLLEKIAQLEKELEKSEEKLFKLLSGDFQSEANRAIEARYQERNLRLEKENDVLKKNIQSVQSELKTKDGQIKSLTVEKEQAIKQSESVQAKIQALEESATRVREKPATNQEEVKKLNTKIKQLEDTLASVKSEKEKISTDYTTLRKEFDSLPKSASVPQEQGGELLRAEMQILQSKLLIQTSQIEAYKSTLADFTARHHKSTILLENAQKEAVELETELAKTKEALAEAKVSLPMQIKEAKRLLEEKISIKEKENKELNDQINQKQKEVDQANKEARSAQSQKADLGKQLEASKEAHAKTLESLKKKEDKKKILDSSVKNP